MGYHGECELRCGDMRRISCFLLLSLLFLGLFSCCFTVYATVIFEDGFEDDFNPWTGTSGNPEVSNSYAHDGFYSCEINGSEYVYIDDSYGNITFVRVYVYFTELPWADGFSMDIINVGNVAAWFPVFVRVKRDSGINYINIRDDFGAQEQFGGTEIVVEQWYSVELRASRTSGTNCTVYLDDSEECTINAVVSGSFDRVMVGGVNALSSVEYIDCVVVSDAYIGLEVEGGDVSCEISENVGVSASLSCTKLLWQSASESTSFSIEGGVVKSIYSVKSDSAVFESSVSVVKLLVFVGDGSFVVTAVAYSALTIYSVAMAVLDTINFESVAYFSGVPEVELEVLDALGIAAIAFILAIVAVGLVGFALFKRGED